MAKKYIDADALINYLYDYQDCEIDIPKEIAEFLAADVVEVIRCKDCTDYDKVNSECSNGFYYEPDGYCSDAKRKDDGEIH